MYFIRLKYSVAFLPVCVIYLMFTTVQANGGPSTSNLGGGGGGRVAVYYRKRTWWRGHMMARGGSSPGANGGAGTIYIQVSL